MDWNVTFKNVGILLLVFIVGCIEDVHAKPSAVIKNVDSGLDPETSHTNVADVFRNVQTMLKLSRPLGGKRKVVKQETDAASGSDGSANALAYLTDSFGGQLAGQILGLILSSITGDVRGILGNSVNLFQNDEQRDRVQVFLDDISKNFLQFTGLGHLTTTRPPSLQGQVTAYPSGPQVGLGIFGGAGVGALQAVSGVPVSSLGAASTGTQSGAFSPVYPGISNTNTGAIGTVAKQPQQQTQQTAGVQQPYIYVLPQLANNGGASDAGSQGSKTNSASKTTSSSGGDDDSEEDREE